MFGWIGVVLSIVDTVLGFFKPKQPSVNDVRERAVAETKLNAEVKTNEEITRAVEAGARVDSELVLHPDSLRVDDGFKRPD